MQTIIEWIFTVLSPCLEVLDIVKWRTTHTWEARRHFRWLIELDVWCCLILQRLTLKSVNHKYCKAVRVQVAVLQKDDTQRAVSKVGNFVKLNYHNVKKKIASCPSEPDSANFTFTIYKKAAFEVLPVPDLTDLPGCNMMRQHALLPVVQSGHKRDAATQASNTVLNNKPRKRGKIACI